MATEKWCWLIAERRVDKPIIRKGLTLTYELDHKCI